MSDILTKKEDIIIALTAYLENCKKAKLTIRYTTLDKDLELTKGSTKQYLKDVLEKTGFEIDEETDAQVVLIRKATPTLVWLQQD